MAVSLWMRRNIRFRLALWRRKRRRHRMAIAMAKAYGEQKAAS